MVGPAKELAKAFIDKGRILLIVAGPNIRLGSRMGRPGRSHSPVLCSWSPIPWLGDGYGIRGQDVKKTLQRQTSIDAEDQRLSRLGGRKLTAREHKES